MDKDVARSPALIWKRSTRNIFRLAERISFSNLLLVLFDIFVLRLLNGQPDIFESLISDLDDKTESFCSGAHEKCTNELQRTSSEHWQQQKQESHHPEPNTPTRKRGTRRCKRYNLYTETTPQDTHERSKRQQVSNDQRKKHFYMDSGAAYHSTFDPSVIKSYPAHLKPPIQAIQGFGGSTILVTGYGYIDGPGGKLKHVLLLPDSTANLMCLGQLTRDYPVKVVFYKDKFWIEGLHNGERIGEGHREDVNHYVVDRFEPDSLLINKRKPSKKKARQYTR